MYAFFTCTDMPCILSAHVGGNHQVEPLLSTACPQCCAERSTTMHSLGADMLKVHESDVKQLVTAPCESAFQTQLVVWGCPSKLDVTLGRDDLCLGVERSVRRRVRCRFVDTGCDAVLRSWIHDSSAPQEASGFSMRKCLQDFSRVFFVWGP